MNFTLATEEDAREIWKLYRAAIGSEGCTWDMEYPNEEILKNDLERKALFCVKTEDGEVVGAISIDDDPEIEQLSCWNKEWQPSGELARLVVKESYRNQSIARKLIEEILKELSKRGYKSAHYLVNQTHYRALNSYAKFEFERKGESDIFDGHWWCYEKKL